MAAVREVVGAGDGRWEDIMRERGVDVDGLRAVVVVCFVAVEAELVFEAPHERKIPRAFASPPSPLRAPMRGRVEQECSSGMRCLRQ